MGSLGESNDQAATQPESIPAPAAAPQNNAGQMNAGANNMNQWHEPGSHGYESYEWHESDGQHGNAQMNSMNQMNGMNRRVAWV